MIARIQGRAVEIDERRVRGGAVGHMVATRERGSVQAWTSPTKKISGAGSNPALSPYHPYRSKLESAFARTLEFDRLAGLIQGWSYERVRFMLPGEKNAYTPDFCVWGYQDDPRPVFYEVKGFNKSDDRSLVKQKTAAGLNPWARFILTKRQKGTWSWVNREIHP